MRGRCYQLQAPPHTWFPLKVAAVEVMPDDQWLLHAGEKPDVFELLACHCAAAYHRGQKFYVTWQGGGNYRDCNLSLVNWHTDGMGRDELQTGLLTT